jgi:hypothetical protein
VVGVARGRDHHGGEGARGEVRSDGRARLRRGGESGRLGRARNVGGDESHLADLGLDAARRRARRTAEIHGRRRSRSRVWGLDTTHETGRVGICPAVVEQGGRLLAFCWTRSMTVRPILYGPCWARDQADYSFSVKFCWAKRKVHELYREIIITVPCDFARKNTKGQKVSPWSWGFFQKAWCHGTVMWFYKMMTQKRMMENLNNHYKLFD